MRRHPAAWLWPTGHPCEREVAMVVQRLKRVQTLRARQTVVRGALGVLAFLAALEVFTRLEVINPAFLPPLSTILATTAELLVTPGFLAMVGNTMLAWLIGVAIAIAFAVPLGVMLGSSAFAFYTSRWVVELVRPVPAVAIIPLVLLLYGQTVQMKIALIVFSAVWPILFNTIYGVRAVEPLAKDTARSFGFGSLSIFARVALPSAAPLIATGIRVGSAHALLVVIAVEIIVAGSGGLGAYIALAGEAADRPELTYGAIVVAGILGLLTNGTMARAERRFMPWHFRLGG